MPRTSHFGPIFWPFAQTHALPSETIAARAEPRWIAVPSMAEKHETIDDYLAALPAGRRAALQKLRKSIKAMAPEAEECISYSMPAFRVAGHVVAGFNATKKGCSYYPFSGSTLQTLAAELAGYEKTKSALHFDPSSPLPRALVRALLMTRLAETSESKQRPPATRRSR